MNRYQYKEYLNGAHWKSVRRRYYAKYGYYCKRCGWTKGLNLHHLTYKNLGHEKLEDLQSLCRKCHMEVHGLLVEHQKERNKWSFEVKIMLIAVLIWLIVSMWFYDK